MSSKKKLLREQRKLLQAKYEMVEDGPEDQAVQEDAGPIEWAKAGWNPVDPFSKVSAAVPEAFPDPVQDVETPGKARQEKQKLLQTMNWKYGMLEDGPEYQAVKKYMDLEAPVSNKRAPADIWNFWGSRPKAPEVEALEAETPEAEVLEACPHAIPDAVPDAVPDAEICELVSDEDLSPATLLEMNIRTDTLELCSNNDVPCDEDHGETSEPEKGYEPSSTSTNTSAQQADEATGSEQGNEDETAADGDTGSSIDNAGTDLPANLFMCCFRCARTVMIVFRSGQLPEFINTDSILMNALAITLCSKCNFPSSSRDEITSHNMAGSLETLRLSPILLKGSNVCKNINSALGKDVEIMTYNGSILYLAIEDVMAQMTTGDRISSIKAGDDDSEGAALPYLEGGFV